MFEDHPDVELIRPADVSEQALIAAVADVDGIAVRSAKLTPQVLAAATRLKAVSRHGVGFDNIAVAELTSRRIPLLLAIHANAVSVAEHTFYLMLSLAKRGRESDRATRQSNFAMRNSPVAIDVAGKVVTIVGFGRIGTRVARRAQAFDMHINVCDPWVDDDVIRAAGCVPVQDYRQVLPETDFLTFHCPLNEDTRNTLGPNELAAMGPGSFVINCARGGIVDEQALAEALSAGRIAGAGVDVFGIEPPAQNNPLLASDKVYLSPHTAGVSIEAARRMSLETANNLIAALFDRYDPLALANPEVALAP